jgi:hypothetical protein
MYESHIQQIEDELTPFGFYNDGQEDDREQVLANF